MSSDRSHWDVAVVGAGVVGLAVGAVLARNGRRVVVIEQEPKVGSMTSSRNSGVIHAGLYYPPGSLKARLCREGRSRLLDRCNRDGIGHALTGKLIVACDPGEAKQLDAIEQNAVACGVASLLRLSRNEVRQREPLLCVTEALWSPESGIVDAHALVESYLREFRLHGGDLVTHTSVTGFSLAPSGVVVEAIGHHGEESHVNVERVVNAAGLGAPSIVVLAGGDMAGYGLAPHYCKGDYFWLSGLTKAPDTALIYPVPSGGGLGVHLTRDLAGRWRAGPDATYVDEISYKVDEAKAEQFANAVRRFFPSADQAQFSPDFSGVRPKLHGPRTPYSDFEIREEGPFVHLLGIESPGLTAAEALAIEVAQRF